MLFIMGCCQILQNYPVHPHHHHQDKVWHCLPFSECRMSNQASGTPANHSQAASAGGMAGQQAWSLSGIVIIIIIVIVILIVIVTRLPCPTTCPQVSTLWAAVNRPTRWASTQKLRFPLMDTWENWVTIFLQVLDKKRLCELVKEVDPAEQLDEDVEDVLLQVFEQILSEKIFQHRFYLELYPDYFSSDSLSEPREFWSFSLLLFNYFICWQLPKTS